MKARALILGVLHRGDFHPYEIRRRIENAMVECYIDVDVGTLYYAINQLEKEGLIVARSHERVARGGMRTIYAITEEGRTAFRELLHRQFDEEGPVAQTLYGALLFLHLADLARVEESLRRRIARLDELIAKLVTHPQTIVAGDFDGRRLSAQAYRQTATARSHLGHGASRRCRGAKGARCAQSECAGPNVTGQCAFRRAQSYRFGYAAKEEEKEDGEKRPSCTLTGRRCRSPVTHCHGRNTQMYKKPSTI